MDWPDPYRVLWHHNDSKGYGRANSTYTISDLRAGVFFSFALTTPYTELRPRAVDIEVERRAEAELTHLPPAWALALANSDSPAVIASLMKPRSKA